MHLRTLIVATLLAALAAAPACGAGDEGEPETKPIVGGDDAGLPEVGPTVPSIASPTANVRFLNASRMSKSFAKALAVPEAELCKELGQYQCVDVIHKISLLGTDPYSFGVNDPLPSTTTSTPLVAERVATSGCILRLQRDLAPHKSPKKVDALFHHLEIDAAGKLDPAGPGVAKTIDLLYVRALQRHATKEETEALRGLYQSIAALPKTPRPAEDWAVASCVAVLTSIESLFY